MTHVHSYFSSVHCPLMTIDLFHYHNSITLHSHKCHPVEWADVSSDTHFGRLKCSGILYLFLVTNYALWQPFVAQSDCANTLVVFDSEMNPEEFCLSPKWPIFICVTRPTCASVLTHLLLKLPSSYLQQPLLVDPTCCKLKLSKALHHREEENYIVQKQGR